MCIQSYLLRTDLIDNIRRIHKVPHLIHTILDSAFRSAYKQKTHTDDHGRNITDEIRTFRDVLWFDTTKTEPERKRKKEGIQQATKATYIEHEHLLNEILGQDWDPTNMTQKEWLHHCRNKATIYYADNKFPLDHRPTPQTNHQQQPTSKNHKTHLPTT